MLRIVSFSYRDNPTPNGWVLDCRKLNNPYRNTNLRMLTGRSKAVQNFVMADPKAIDMLEEAYDGAHFEYDNTIAFGCTGGQHRSVTLAEQLYHLLLGDPPRDNLQITHLNLKGNQ